MPRGTDLGGWNTGFVAQLAAPGTQKVTLVRGGRTEQVLIDGGGGSWGALRQDEADRRLVRRGGPEPLRDVIEEHVTRWRVDGAPPPERFTITVSPKGRHTT
ncbi:hypothetical protein [Streptomyces triticisoli]|jgi:hypothetical protein|uniref:hypothetical protein n=1 Tax=Streptomyces triticisoli TaxID=2182797 RepID=UPI0013009D1E|nr:hypothetical protein [Streptomyces triticisoli]